MNEAMKKTQQKEYSANCVEIAKWMADQILEHAELHLDTARVHIRDHYGSEYLQAGGLAPRVRKTFHEVLDERELAAEWKKSHWTWYRDTWVPPHSGGLFQNWKSN